MKARPTPAGYAQALIDVHTAFNGTAGRAVFEHELEGFFTDHPRFAAVRRPIESLFAESRRVFYAIESADLGDTPPLGPLRDLCHACRNLERAR